MDSLKRKSKRLSKTIVAVAKALFEVTHNQGTASLSEYFRSTAFKLERFFRMQPVSPIGMSSEHPCAPGISGKRHSLDSRYKMD